MERLQAFQAVAHESGFVDVQECDDGTVLWLRRETQDAATQTHQRICIDSLTNSVTVYWTTSDGRMDSKTFRTASGLQEWLAPDPVNNVLNDLPRIDQRRFISE